MMETGGVVWRGVCCGIIGALLWFGLASPQPFRRNRDDGGHEIRRHQVGKSRDRRPAAPRHTHHGGLPACRGALNACQENLETCQSDLGTLDASLETCQSDLGTLDASLKTCQSDLGTFDASLKTCQSDLGTLDASLKTCQSDLGTLDTSLETCQSDLGTLDTSLETCQSELGTCQSDLGLLDAALETCQAQAQTFPATGQMGCWDFRGDPVACEGTGHDGNIQAGAQLDYADNGDGTITDENTHLMWEKLCDADPGEETCPAEHDMGTPYRWEEAFEKIAMLNTEPCFATYCDWRLPNVKELQSIVNYQNADPAVSQAFDNNCKPSCSVTTCSCTAPGVYWSSTSNSLAGKRTEAWGVSFSQGEVGTHSKFFSSRGVRAVRGP